MATKTTENVSWLVGYADGFAQRASSEMYRSDKGYYSGFAVGDADYWKAALVAAEDKVEELKVELEEAERKASKIRTRLTTARARTGRPHEEQWLLTLHGYRLHRVRYQPLSSAEPVAACDPTLALMSVRTGANPEVVRRARKCSNCLNTTDY